MDRTTLLNIHAALTAPFKPKAAVAVDNEEGVFPSPARATALRASKVIDESIALVDELFELIGHVLFEAAKPLGTRLERLMSSFGRRVEDAEDKDDGTSSTAG